MPLEQAEEARAAWLERFPEGFEERADGGTLELAAYAEGVPADLADADVDDVADDWQDRWRTFHRPARVGALWVGPPWETPPRDAIAVVIDPGRAFGTGAHPTTRLCLEWLLELGAASVLDVGCGSGVLAIAAAKIGCRPVFAVDDDPAAIDATDRNARANGVEVTAVLADARVGALPQADVAVANISADAIAEVAPHLSSRTLVTSGYLARSQLALDAFVHAGRRESEGWAADLWQRPQ